MGNCLQQPRLLLNQPHKSMRVTINPLRKSCFNRTVPAAETKSIGLLSNAHLSWFLHLQLDSYIVKGQLLLVYRDFATLTVSPRR
jgi:hypothetical protein